jgi:outer membrane protein OmpA-like peptidoglycan-associated protein
MGAQLHGFVRVWGWRSLAMLLLAGALAAPAMAQGSRDGLIEKGNYDKARVKLLKDLGKDPGDVPTLYSLTKLYSTAGNPGSRSDSAYLFIREARLRYNAADLRDRERWVKDGLNDQALSDLKWTVIQQAFDRAMAARTTAAAEHFLKVYDEAPAGQRDRARALIATLAYESALQRNTIDAYTDFLKRFPGAAEAAAATEKRNTLAYEQARLADDIDAYEAFLRTYPLAREATKAMERRDELAFAEAERANTLDAYEDFVVRHPKARQVAEARRRLHNLAYAAIANSTRSADFDTYLSTYPESEFASLARERRDKCFIAERTHAGDGWSFKRFVDQFPKHAFVPTAIDSMHAIATRTHDILLLKHLLDTQAESLGRDRLADELYGAASKDGRSSTLEWLREQVGWEGLSGAEEEAFQEDMQLAAMLSGFDLDRIQTSQIPQIEAYIKAAAPRRMAYDALVALAQNLIGDRNWSEALRQVERFDRNFGNDRHYLELMALLKAREERDVKRTPFGPPITAKSGWEYVPTISGDGEVLLFCGRNRPDNIGGEDIFESRAIGGRWAAPAVVDELSSTSDNDAPVHLSTDGTELYLFRNGDLMHTQRTSYGWEEPTDLGEPINVGPWNSDAQLTADGQALLFTSQRDGGYNVDEADHRNEYPTDIYVSERMANGKWGPPINLGAVINTTGCERTPFLHPDMRTLYFSSDGHGGLGRLDVYRTRRLSEDSWTHWSTPENLGKEINGVGRDWGYKFSTDGTWAYFSGSEAGSGNFNATAQEDQQLYRVNIPPRLRPDHVATVKGQLLDSDNKPVSAKLVWEDLSTATRMGEANSDPADGSYFITLPMGRIYGYYTETETFFPISGNLDLRAAQEAEERVDTIRLFTLDELVAEGRAMPINNIFFEFGRKDLLPFSIPELRRVAAVLKQHGLRVEIAGHTDDVGTDAMNQELSEWRAATVRNFLVRQGCDPDQLTTIGYGKSRPVADNTTDAGRALNRRVELRFLEE